MIKESLKISWSQVMSHTRFIIVWGVHSLSLERVCFVSCVFDLYLFTLNRIIHTLQSNLTSTIIKFRSQLSFMITEPVSNAT